MSKAVTGKNNILERKRAKTQGRERGRGGKGGSVKETLSLAGKNKPTRKH